MVLPLALLLLAQDASQSPPEGSVPPDEATDPETDERLKRLERENQRLGDELLTLRQDLEATQADVTRLLPLAGRISGYLDFGFFDVRGSGAGTRTDIGNRVFPEYAGVVPGSWVFMGDPLSTAINSRGDPADTGESRAVTFDPVDAQGHPTFILNAVHLALFAGISPTLQLNAALDFVPRGRDVSDPDGLFLGDYVEVPLGYVEYRPALESLGLSLFAGKFDSVLGVEYRTQEAPDRLAVTPSLICRYTCGRPLGVKARLLFFDELLILNTAVTNGSQFTEGFPFYDEVDANAMKTGSARLSLSLPLGSAFEVGASGAYGAQDLQPEDDVDQWHYGFDLMVDWQDVLLSAEFVQGEAPGLTEAGQPPCGLAPCLDYKGAYGLVGYRAANWLTPYARVDWRDALHQSGASFVYVSELVRFTVGAHFEIGTHVVAKAEYTLNRELGRLPPIPNDVLTTSLSVRY